MNEDLVQKYSGAKTNEADPNADLINKSIENANQDLVSQFSGTTAKKGIFSRTLAGIGGFVGKVGEVLSTGQYAQVAGTEKLLEKTGVLQKTPETLVDKFKQQKSNYQLLRKIGEETGKGGLLTGQYEYNPNTFFGNFIRELPSATIGVLADVFLDPITYIGGALIKPLKYATKEVKPIVKTLAEEIPAIQKMGQMLGKAFITRFGQREAFKEADISRKIVESQIKEEVAKIVSPIIEKPATIQQRITQVVTGGITTKEELKTIAEPLRQELDRVGESISKINPKLLDEKLFEANKGTYFPRLYSSYEFPTEEKIVGQMFGQKAVSIPRERFLARTPDEEFAKKYLYNQGTDFVKTKYPSAIFTRESNEYIQISKIPSQDIQEFAKLARKGLGQIQEAGYPALKGLTQLRVVEERQKFFQNISKIASDTARPGWIQMSSDKALGSLANKFLPAAEYKAITNLRKVPTKLGEMYKAGLMTWKTFKTAYNPATIARNDITNLFILNPLGSVPFWRLDVYAGAFNDLLTKSHIYQLARKEGLEISTQQSAELTSKATRFYRQNQSLVSQFFNKIQDFHEMVKNFYGNQDKFFKLANFRKGILEDGLTPFEAMRRANFYLVDYSEVPELVAWLRNQPFGVPFISFTYGVSKPLAKTLLESPQKLANYFKVLRGIQDMNPTGETPADRQKENDVLPDWISTGNYLRLPFKDKFGRGQYVNLQYILPFNVVETNQLTPSNPVFTITASLLLNKDAFTGKELYLKTDTLMEKSQKIVKHIWQQLMPSTAPFGWSFEKVKNVIQNRPDRFGYVKDWSQVLLDVLGGIKITPVDYSIQAKSRASEKQKELQELKSQLIKIMLDKSIFPEEKAKEKEKVVEKIKALNQ